MRDCIARRFLLGCDHGGPSGKMGESLQMDNLFRLNIDKRLPSEGRVLSPLDR